MSEHQQMQKPGKPEPTFQKQAALTSLNSVSHPASIIQRARIDPKSLTAADVLQLQRTIGNRAVCRLLSEIRNPSKVQQVPIQRQEVLEEEKEPLQGIFGKEPEEETCPSCVQRQEKPEEEEPLQGKFETIQRLKPEEDEKLQMKSIVQRQESPEEEEPIQGKMIGTIQRQEIPEEEPLQKKSENNTGMPDNLKAGVESLSGIDMSDVRVHYNSDKPAEVGALAYTQGTNIHVAPGQEKHLPHEAWHVVQQAKGRVQPTLQMNGVAVNDDVGLEREADLMGGMAELKPMLGGTSLNKSHEIKTNIVQCRLGVEIELNNPKIAPPQNKEEGSGDKEWDKRDVICRAPFWDLTIDDTPGGGRFNLEFILNGKSRNGFEDDEIELVLYALDSIEEYLLMWGDGPIVFHRAADGKRNGELVVTMPSKMPPSANVQVTTGMSLVGLQKLLEDSKLELDEDRTPQLKNLVEREVNVKKLITAYVPPDKIKSSLEEQLQLSEYPESFDRLCKSLSAMLTLIQTFIENTGQANIKESTPILWKTPLDKFFSDADIQKGFTDLACRINTDVKELESKTWRALVFKIFKLYLAKEITYPPSGPHSEKFSIGYWLLGLPYEDKLTKQDQYYDKSIGGIGRLEGGSGPSEGHPIFELRNFPNTYKNLKQNITSAYELLNSFNKR